MIIREFYFNEECRNLYVEFSVKHDNDDYYRVVELDYEDVLFYYSEPIVEDDFPSLEEDDIIEILKAYFLENDLPEQQYL